MHNLLQPFIFTGAQVAAGDAVYVALWGGAGSQTVFAYSTSGQWVNPHGGSGGLVLAKISGLGATDVCTVYVGGRGGASGSHYATSTLWTSGPAPETMSNSNSRQHGGASGAASALTLQVGGTAAEEFLLIAPSGGGGGGSWRTAGVTATAYPIKFGGDGTFSGVDLGRATVSAPTATLGENATNITSEAGGFGQSSLLGIVNALIGRQGEAPRNYKPGRGGGGAPDGSGGVVDRKYGYSDGGSGGKGFIHGGASVGAQETLYSTTYSNHGANITIEAVGIDGREIRPHDANYDSQFDRVAALRSGGGALGNFVTEVTDALGWATATGSEINWPPQLGDRSTEANPEQSIADPSTSPRRTIKTYPGQGGQHFQDDGTALPTGRSGTILDNTTNWHSNGGAAMLKFGDSCYGFQANNYQGARTDGLTSADTGAEWLPTSDGGNLVARPQDAVAGQSFGVAFGGAPDYNLIDANFTFDAGLDPYLSAASATTITGLSNGQIAVDYYPNGVSSVIYQVQNGAMYSADLADASPAFATTTDVTGVDTAAGTLRAAAMWGGSFFAYTRDDETLLIDNTETTPAAVQRDRTASILAASNRDALTIDDYGFVYVGAANGNVDVFDATDAANFHPVVHGEADVQNNVDSMTYDPKNDLLWINDGTLITPVAIVRDAQFKPTLLQSLDVGSSTQVTRTYGTTGVHDDIFYVGEDTLLQQNGTGLQLLDISSAQPNRGFITADRTVGRYLRLTSTAQFADTNVAPPSTVAAMTVIMVVRWNTLSAYQPWMTFFDPTGTLADHQCVGLARANPDYGLYEADLSPRRSTQINGGPVAGEWFMIGWTCNGTTYNNWSTNYVNGALAAGSGGSSGGATTVNGLTGFTTQFGINDPAFLGSMDSDIAFARVYGSVLTAAQITRVWDHWCERNSAIFTANGQAVPAYTAGEADYLGNLYGEWDFSKMSGQTLKTTQGNAGVVTGTLGGGATII